MLATGPYRQLSRLTERLEQAGTIVRAAVLEKEERQLMRSLEDGSYGSKELDSLFELIKKPLRAAVTVYAGWNLRGPVTRSTYDPGDDPFYLAVASLSNPNRPPSGEGIPAIDLLDFSRDAEDEGFGRRGTAQVGLVRRLIRHHGLDRIEAMIQQVIDDPEGIRPPQVESGEEVARLLRLVAPIERKHMFPILWFRSPTGRVVESTFDMGSQCVPSYYMGVDK